ncbi:MAG: hypothetical protein K9G83_06045, partial [Hyphomonadaceae bacterium]|nr:hypothetical protein [Hyphomonadaceae bacterium]
MLGALFAGRPRRQFYSDVFHFSDAPEAAHQVAAGYICLAGALAWTLGGITVLWLNPLTYAVIALAAFNAAVCIIGFLHLRWKRDPRVALDWLLGASLVSAILIAYVNSGIIAPVVFSLPVIAGIAALFQRPKSRVLSAALGVLAIGTSVLAALGVIGEPTTYSHESYVIRVFIVLIAVTLGLGAIAWLSGVSRDYLLDQTTLANNAIVVSAARAGVALEAGRVGLWDVPEGGVPRFDVSESFQA